MLPKLLLIFSFMTTILGGSRSFADSAIDPDFEKFLFDNHYGAVLTEGYGNKQTFYATINGKNVFFILDSGSAYTVVTWDGARRANLKIIKTKEKFYGVGGTGKETIDIAPIQSFVVNGWQINRLSTIHVLPQSGVGGTGGLFGYDLLHLNSAVVVIGGAGFLIRPGLLTQPPSLEKYMIKKGFSPVPLKVVNNSLYVQGNLNGRPFQAVVDTGSTFTLFDQDFVSRSGGHPGNGKGFIGGVEGDDRIAVADFEPDSISIGNLHPNRELFLTGTSPGLRSQHLQAYLGFDFLSAHHAVLDAGANILWMKP